MSVELMLLAVNINLVAFSAYLGDLTGQVFTLFVLTVAAAEAAIGLAILVCFFRNRGTIGGSLANNDPAADYPAAVLGLNATVITNKREIAAEDYFDGMFTTVLEDGELITAVRFPVPEKAAYTKFPNPASRYALVGVMVAQTGGDTRVAVTGAGQDGVFRATDIESALSSNCLLYTSDAADE